MQKPPPSKRYKRTFLLGVLFLVACVLSGAGCSFIDLISLVQNDISAAPSVVPTSPGTQENLPPDPTPLPPETFPEPAGQIQSSYPFDYQCNPYLITLPLYQSSYQYFQDQDKYFYYQGDLPEDWQAQFYLNFLSSSDDLETVEQLIAEVSRAIGQRGDELVIALVNLVQQLNYDCNKLFSFDQLGGAGYQTNYPYETLYTRTGVCGDTSLLLGKILQELGYGSAFLIYDQNNHMALGIQCPVSLATYVKDQTGYCYIETTSPSRIGVKPTNIGGREFTENPEVIPIGGGKTFTRMTTLAAEMEGEVNRYGQKILQLATCQEIQLYQEIKEGQLTIEAHDGHLVNLGIAFENAKDKYEEELEIFQSMGCQGTVPPAKYQACLDQQAIVQEEFATYENAVTEYNRVVDLRNADVNRMNLAVDQFNGLMDANNQSCAVVFSERIPEPEESE